MAPTVPVSEDFIDMDDQRTMGRRHQVVVLNRHGECKVCLGSHDEETHLATLGLRDWFRGEVLKSFMLPVG